MYPISYKTLEDGTIEFIYEDKEYSEWVKMGEKYGTVGCILKSYKGKWSTFHSYGTLEHPLKQMQRITFIHHPLFDGERMPPEWYLKEQAEKREQEYWKEMNKHSKIVILDITK